MASSLINRLLSSWFSGKGKKPYTPIEGNPQDFWQLVDMGFTASWDKKTGESIKRRMEAGRRGLLTDSEMFTYLGMLDDVTRRKYEDQTINPHKYDNLIPLEGCYKFDKLTTYGLALFCALIVQKNVIPPTHMAAGDGEGPTEDYSDLLVSEQVRYSFANDGYMNSLNKLIRFHMTFDILEDSFSVKEIGLFNVEDENTGPMISRTTFDPAVEHIYGENFFTASYLITTLSA